MMDQQQLQQYQNQNQSDYNLGMRDQNDSQNSSTHRDSNSIQQQQRYSMFNPIVENEQPEHKQNPVILQNMDMLDSGQHIGIDDFYDFLKNLSMFQKGTNDEDNQSYQLLLQQFNKLLSIKKNFKLITSYIDYNLKLDSMFSDMSKNAQLLFEQFDNMLISIAQQVNTVAISVCYFQGMNFLLLYHKFQQLKYMLKQRKFMEMKTQGLKKIINNVKTIILLKKQCKKKQNYNYLDSQKIPENERRDHDLNLQIKTMPFNKMLEKDEDYQQNINIKNSVKKVDKQNTQTNDNDKYINISNDYQSLMDLKSMQKIVKKLVEHNLKNSQVEDEVLQVQVQYKSQQKRFVSSQSQQNNTSNKINPQQQQQQQQNQNNQQKIVQNTQGHDIQQQTVNYMVIPRKTKNFRKIGRTQQIMKEGMNDFSDFTTNFVQTRDQEHQKTMQNVYKNKNMECQILYKVDYV